MKRRVVRSMIIVLSSVYMVQAAPVIEIKNKNDFEKRVLKSGKPAVVKFYSQSCGPCQESKTPFEQVAKEPQFKDIIFATVDVGIGANDPISEKYDIGGIPSFRYLGKDGKLKGKNEGFSDPVNFKKRVRADIEEFSITAAPAAVAAPTKKPSKPTKKPEAPVKKPTKPAAPKKNKKKMPQMSAQHKKPATAPQPTTCIDVPATAPQPVAVPQATEVAPTQPAVPAALAEVAAPEAPSSVITEPTTEKLMYKGNDAAPAMAATTPPPAPQAAVEPTIFDKVVTWSKDTLRAIKNKIREWVK